MDEVAVRNPVSRCSRLVAASCAVAILATFAACSGGSGGGSGNPNSPAPTGLSYPAPPNLVRGAAMTPLNPTVNGIATSYSVAPALPAGLSVASATGVISGTPTAVTSTASYVVTASNTGGSTTASVSITVNDVVPDIFYPSTTFTFTTGIPVDLLPQNNGGPAVNWSINPALPAGLTFSAVDGGIRGAPTAVSALVAYVVTATNSGGSDTTNLVGSVESGVLLDLGHMSQITDMEYDGARLLTRELLGRWVMWDSQTAEMIASGSTPCDSSNSACGWAFRLAGPTLAIRQANSVELRSSADGSLLADVTIVNPTLARWDLSTDGNYLSAADSTGVRVWSRTGTPLFTHPGDYRFSRPFAVAGEVRIAAGPAGANVIEKLAVPSGTATTTPVFLGTFHSWFLDGGRFLTNAGNVVRVFSHAGVQEDFVSLPNLLGLAGRGARYWRREVDKLDLYAVGGGGTPTATYPYGQLAQVTNTNAVLSLSANNTLTLVDTNGVAADRAYTLPSGFHVGRVAASAVDDWFMGGTTGLVADGRTLGGPLEFLNHGQVRSIAGGGNRVAIALAAGYILYFDAVSGTLEGQLDVQSGKVQLSDDGSVLATMTPSTVSSAGSVEVYALPSEVLLRRWDYPSDLPNDIALSGNGLALGRAPDVPGSGRLRVVTDVATDTVMWSDNTPGNLPILIAPSVGHIALPTGPPSGGVGTNIYTNGVLTSATPGYAQGWLDNDQLFVATFGPGVRVVFAANNIVNASGQVIGTTPVPSINNMLRVNATAVLGQRASLLAIYSLTTGMPIWSYQAPDQEGIFLRQGIAGGHVIFATKSVVRFEWY